MLADTAFLGADLLAWLVLALGGAMVVGNLLALLRPPPRPRQGELARPPVARSALYVAIGGVAAIWAVATLAHG
jgi:hypothetical protein